MSTPAGADAARLRRERVRALGREVTVDEIKARAREQLAADGIPGISLRGIGRSMGLTASALYRYFPSRDDLITSLVVDAYHGVADAMDDALAGCGPDAFRHRFVTVTTAFRLWALAHPAQFGLIFGTPAPGYAAPREVAFPAASRTYGLLAGPLGAAHRAGVLAPPHPPVVEGAYLRQLQALVDRRVFDVPPHVLAGCFHSWAVLQGLVTLAVFGHLQPGFGDAGAMFAAEIDALADRLGLPRPPA